MRTERALSGGSRSTSIRSRSAPVCSLPSLRRLPAMQSQAQRSGLPSFRTAAGLREREKEREERGNKAGDFPVPLPHHGAVLRAAPSGGMAAPERAQETTEERAAGEPCAPAHLPNPKHGGRKGPWLLCRVVKIYTKPHVCILNIASFYHQVGTACKHELCKTINCRLIRGSSCRGCWEDTAVQKGQPVDAQCLRVSELQRGRSHGVRSYCSRGPAHPALSH